jgi:2-aminoadipate transaminase
MGVEREDLISLAAGLVDFGTLPSQDLADIAADLLQGERRSARVPLQYGTTEGHAALRGKLLSHLLSLDGLTADDSRATPDDIVISSGSQQLLFLLTDVLVDEGDIVITAWPSYFVYTGALKAFGAEVRCVEIDSNGMKPESLEGLLETLKAEGRLGRVKIVYVQPDHQNPTGMSLAVDRREPIARIVERFSIDHRILLIDRAAHRLRPRTARPRRPNPLSEGRPRLRLVQSVTAPDSGGDDPRRVHPTAAQTSHSLSGQSRGDAEGARR